MNATVQLTGKARTFPSDEIIVSKTDAAGRLTYANDIFLNISDYTEAELLGKPHNIIRHPDMPGCIFKLLWETLPAGQELFAYVNNRTKYGDNYWVLAHVTPTFDEKGTIIGYHSSRRSPSENALKIILPLYEKLRAEERRHEKKKEGLAASSKMLQAFLDEKGMAYDAFIFTVINA
jgi:PAS domain S-box-containing protein